MRYNRATESYRLQRAISDHQRVANCRRQRFTDRDIDEWRRRRPATKWTYRTVIVNETITEIKKPTSASAM